MILCCAVFVWKKREWQWRSSFFGRRFGLSQVAGKPVFRAIWAGKGAHLDSFARQNGNFRRAVWPLSPCNLACFAAQLGLFCTAVWPLRHRQKVIKEGMSLFFKYLRKSPITGEFAAEGLCLGKFASHGASRFHHQRGYFTTFLAVEPCLTMSIPLAGTPSSEKLAEAPE